MAKDLICGMQVDEQAAAGTSEYQGKMYYFCSPGCKAAFEKEPETSILRPVVPNVNPMALNLSPRAYWWRLIGNWNDVMRYYIRNF